jgi:Family of unknown function (DUF5715)/LysM domain
MPKHADAHPRPLLRSALLPVATLSLALLTAAGPPATAQSLDGSRASLLRQNLGAQQEGVTYLRTSGDVQDFVQRGLLVPLTGNADYLLATDEVSFPVARPEVKAFIEQLAHHYRAACGEPLVVTSATRPISRQPRNASEISVHPTGIAVDLRRSDRGSCRRYLETTLLSLEGKGLVEATREHWPAHYHVAVFAEPNLRYLDGTPDELPAPQMAALEAAGAAAPAVPYVHRHPAASGDVATAVSSYSYRSSSTARGRSARGRHGRSRGRSRAVHAKSYRVGRGDNLWRIARRHRTSVAELERANNIHSTGELKPGQVLAIPGAK